MQSCAQVVIVEDDPGIREILREVIELEGYQVRTACNGQAAFELLKSLAPPCLILTDLSMPVMDGYEFIELASQTHTIAVIPIVVVSAAMCETKVKAATESGKVKGLIKKPVDMDYLMRVIHEHCGPALQKSA